MRRSIPAASMAVMLAATSAAQDFPLGHWGVVPCSQVFSWLEEVSRREVTPVERQTMAGIDSQWHAIWRITGHSIDHVEQMVEGICELSPETPIFDILDMYITAFVDP